MTTTKDSPNLHLDFVEIVAPRLWISTVYKNTYVANAAPAAALDVTQPLAGWYDCGSIKAVKVPVAKTVREYMRGIPQTSRKQWETTRTAQVTFNTSDLTPYVEALINGQTVYNTLTGGKTNVGSLFGLGHKSVLLASSAAGLTQYDIVVCASPLGGAPLATNFNLAVVESLTASVLVLEGGGFPILTVAGDRVHRVSRVAFLDKMGTSTIRSAMLFWDDVVDSAGSVQVQHAMYFPKIQNFTGQDLDFKSETEEYESSITLAAQAVEMTFDDGTTGYDFYKKWILAY